MTGEIKTACQEIGEFSASVYGRIYELDKLAASAVDIEAVVGYGGALFVQAHDSVNGEQYSVPVQDMDPLEADRIAGYFLRWFNAEDRSEF